MERKIRAQFYGVAETDLPQLVILSLYFQEHKSHLNNAFLESLSSPWPGKQGGSTPGAFGCTQSCPEPQPWYSTAQQTPQLPTDLSSTCSEPLLHISPQEDAGKTSLPPPWGHRFPGEDEPGTALLFPPQQSIIHPSDISPANLAKQKCFFFF